MESMQIHWFSIGFKHIATFEAISTYTTVNGTGARSTFRKFTQEIRCFFSLILLMFRELRATAPQTYYRFRTSNGTADVLYVLLDFLTPLGFYSRFVFWTKKKLTGRICGRYIYAKSFFVKTTADQKQGLRRTRFLPQTYDKSKMEILEVNFL